MNQLSVNFLAIFVCAVASMMVGAIWYGPLFGKKWMEVTGVDLNDKAVLQKMQKSAGPLYGLQFILTLFQVFVIALMLGQSSKTPGYIIAIWLWAAFIIPTLAGAIMWTGKSAKLRWQQFLIQGGYQLLMFIIFGVILTFWK